ncbi:MAG: hypothetical protein ACJ8ED_23880 [Xanthobacteraceae bacterium]
MAMNVEAEIRDLKRRVSELEGSFGFLPRQVKDVHKALLAFEARTQQRFDKVDGRFEKLDGRFEKVDGRFNKVEGRLDRVEGKLDHIDRGLRGLREDMPGIVGDAIRAAQRERRPKARKTS